MKPENCISYCPLSRKIKAENLSIIVVEGILGELEILSKFSTQDLFPGFRHIKGTAFFNHMIALTFVFDTFWFEFMPVRLNNTPTPF